MNAPTSDRLRAATAADVAQLLLLWESVYDDGSAQQESWKAHARDWFIRCVDDRATACFPVIELDGVVVATGIGTLELGVPNPHCPMGRTVRLANVVTLPDHRGNGYGTRVVLHVIEWARSIHADRVDLSTTPAGRRIYEQVGFRAATAPRMKLVL